MRLEVRLEQGVGPLDLGAFRAAVRAVMGGEIRQIDRGGTPEFPADYFPKAGLFAYYDSQGRLTAVEMARPAAAVLDGVDLLHTEYGSAPSLLKARDPTIEIDPAGATSHVLGVGLYAPNGFEDPTELVEGVIVFRDGFYQDPV